MAFPMGRLSGGMAVAPRFELDDEAEHEFISLRRLWRRVRLLKERQTDISRAFEYIDDNRGCVFDVSRLQRREGVRRSKPDP